jgi:hypothetical protein
VVVDDQDNLWVLDPAAPKMQEIVKGGPKLVKIDLVTNQVVQTIPSGEDVATKKSYLNDVNERKPTRKTIVDDVECCARAPVRPGANVKIETATALMTTVARTTRRRPPSSEISRAFVLIMGSEVATAATRVAFFKIILSLDACRHAPT